MGYRISAELFGRKYIDYYGRQVSVEVLGRHDEIYWRLDWLGSKLGNFLEGRTPREIIDYFKRNERLFKKEFSDGSPEANALETLMEVRTLVSNLPSGAILNVISVPTIQLNSSLASRPAVLP